MRKRSQQKKTDAQAIEFERRDLGDDFFVAGTAKVLLKHTKPTSILLDEGLIKKLREKGVK